jgi:hypothetical protein
MATGAPREGALPPGDWHPEHLAEFVMSDISLDLLMVALALAFFALSLVYAYACDRL